MIPCLCLWNFDRPRRHGLTPLPRATQLERAPKNASGLTAEEEFKQAQKVQAPPLVASFFSLSCVVFFVCRWHVLFYGYLSTLHFSSSLSLSRRLPQ